MATEHPRLTESHAPSWQDRLDSVYELMREMSLQTDPQAMVRAYGRRLSKMYPTDRRLSLSRRGLQFPWYRITRYSEWEDEINPWEEKDRLPVLSGGILAELIYSDRPQVIDELQVVEDDPAFEYLKDQQSLMAIPLLDNGQALNMVVLTRESPNAFEHERFPDTFWLANLFGRATSNLVLSREVKAAYDAIDREFRIVGDIQRSLLADPLPEIPGLELAASYQTSKRAGGDYYDFFRLDDGKWGLLIADVSGHGTPAAVVMAITHSIAHLHRKDDSIPGDLLGFINRQLTKHYTSEIGGFVTAFYGIYDPATRSLDYASAGHNPPIVKKCKTKQLCELSEAASLPMGIDCATKFESARFEFQPGDYLVMYTDGIVEAEDPAGLMYGRQRLADLLDSSCGVTPQQIVSEIDTALSQFTQGAPPNDDRTLVIARCHGNRSNE